MTPGDPDLARAFETTWPAAEYADAGAFRVGRGYGAGGRVSSARALRQDWDEADIPAVEAIHHRWRQQAMFRVPDGDALAGTLARHGYAPETPTAIMAAECGLLMVTPVPQMTAFALWPPLAIQGEIWAAGNIGAARQAVLLNAGAALAVATAALAAALLAAAVVVVFGVLAALKASNTSTISVAVPPVLASKRPQ